MANEADAAADGPSREDRVGILNTWQGLWVWQAKWRKQSCAGWAPHRPTRYLSEPFSVSAFGAAAESACDSHQQALNQALSVVPPWQAGESLDVSDLREPSAADILAAARQGPPPPSALLIPTRPARRRAAAAKEAAQPGQKKKTGAQAAAEPAAQDGSAQDPAGSAPLVDLTQLADQPSNSLPLPGSYPGPAQGLLALWQGDLGGPVTGLATGASAGPSHHVTVAGPSHHVTGAGPRHVTTDHALPFPAQPINLPADYSWVFESLGVDASSDPVLMLPGPGHATSRGPQGRGARNRGRGKKGAGSYRAQASPQASSVREVALRTQLLDRWQERFKSATGQLASLKHIVDTDGGRGMKGEAGEGNVGLASGPSRGATDTQDRDVGVVCRKLVAEAATAHFRPTGNPVSTLTGLTGPCDVDWRSEVLVTVCVYPPRRMDSADEEYVFLGSQPLTALADSVRCVSQQNLESVNAQGSTGSYIFVNGRFYNDTRDPSHEDLSKPIRDMCQRHNVVPVHMSLKLGSRTMVYRAAADVAAEAAAEDAPDADAAAPLPSAHAMQEACFVDLCCAVSNTPLYLYCHLGCCEHMISVRDVRRMHPHDPPQRSAYPLRQLHPHRPSQPRRRCDVCDLAHAARVVYDDPLAVQNPCFFCARCLDMLHPEGLPAGATAYPLAAHVAQHAEGGVTHVGQHAEGAGIQQGAGAQGMENV